MDKKTEALKLALERLEWFVDSYPHDITTSKEEFLRPFNEALAEQPAQQEPVACREDIIRMAREAGLDTLNGFRDDNTTSVYYEAWPEQLERFAALVAAASEEQWKHAVINELVCCHIYNAAHDSDPRKALHDAISWNVQVALDPQVSSDAQALIDRGAAAEREACAKVLDEMAADAEAEIEPSQVVHYYRSKAAAIRARGETSSRGQA